MSTGYDDNYQPPFPRLTIRLENGDEQLGPFPALLDTGADITFIPTDLLEEVGAVESVQAQIRSHFGELQPVQLYLIGIQVDSVSLVGLYVVGDDMGDEVILGRDVLNKLPLFLDGPQTQTDILGNAVVQRLRRRN